MENLLVSIIGSLIVLDTTVAFQFLISQPLVACTLVGWLLGDVQLGLQIGAYLQMLWLCSMPVGAAVLPEGNVAAIIITTLVIKNTQGLLNFNTLFVCCVFYGIIASYLGGQIVVFLRKNNLGLLHRALSSANSGNLSIIGKVSALALLIHFVTMFALILILLIIGDYLIGYAVTLPLSWDIYFKYGLISILGIGAGLVIPIFKGKNYKLIILIGIIIGSIIFFL